LRNKTDFSFYSGLLHFAQKQIGFVQMMITARNGMGFSLVTGAIPHFLPIPVVKRMTVYSSQLWKKTVVLLTTGFGKK